LKVSLQGQELLSELSDQSPPNYDTKAEGIPLAGSVAAGVPVEAVENIELLSLSSTFGSRDDIFALEVTGDSMIDEDIHQGDYVICRRSHVADDGQLVVAIVDDENATLKRFYKEKGRARLQPANDDYQPIYTNNCRIEAVVIGLLRKF
jgi:repressor LexA